MAAKKNVNDYSIHVIRENLRLASLQQAALLERSVGRLTSYDAQPCTEYGQEITAQYDVIDELLYLQQCRNALERCIATGTVRLRYHWRDGRVTDTRFRKVSPGRIRVSGLQTGTALAAAG